MRALALFPSRYFIGKPSQNPAMNSGLKEIARTMTPKTSIAPVFNIIFPHSTLTSSYVVMLRKHESREKPRVLLTKTAFTLPRPAPLLRSGHL